jgi:hypothetical protein
VQSENTGNAIGWCPEVDLPLPPADIERIQRMLTAII